MTDFFERPLRHRRQRPLGEGADCTVQVFPRRASVDRYATARMNVYLPDDIHEQVKAHELPVSDLLQQALRLELRRRELCANADALVRGRDAIVGPPTKEERARVRGILQRISRRGARKAS